jgi:effector-binding domain-containing protein
MDYEVRVRTVPARSMAAMKFRSTVAELPSRMKTVFGAVMGYMSKAGICPSGPAVTLYDQVTDDVFDVTAGFYVPSAIPGDQNVVAGVVPAGEVATTTHLGPYDGLPQAYQALQDWMRAHGRKPAGTAMWEEYLTGPETPPNQTRTDIFWPLAPQ